MTVTAYLASQAWPRPPPGAAAGRGVTIATVIAVTAQDHGWTLDHFWKKWSSVHTWRRKTLGY